MNNEHSFVFGNWQIYWHGSFDRNFLKIVKFVKFWKFNGDPKYGWWKIRIGKFQLEHFVKPKRGK